MFLDIFSTVLYNNSKLDGKTDYTQRLQIITKDLFAVCYDRVARGMIHADRLTFALLLCRIHLKGTSEHNLDAEFNFFLRSREGLLANQQQIEGLTTEQIESVNRLASRLPIFKALIEKIKSMPELSAWLQQGSPEQNVSKCNIFTTYRYNYSSLSPFFLTFTYYNFITFKCRFHNCGRTLKHCHQYRQRCINCC